jgi:hypothetical protein
MGNIGEEVKQDTGNVDKWCGRDQQRGMFGYDTVKEVRVMISRTNSESRS